MNPEMNVTPRKREHPVELELDQLGSDRAKRRYVSEFLSSELTALSLYGNESKASIFFTFRSCLFIYFNFFFFYIIRFTK